MEDRGQIDTSIDHTPSHLTDQDTITFRSVKFRIFNLFNRTVMILVTIIQTLEFIRQRTVVVLVDHAEDHVVVGHADEGDGEDEELTDLNR